MTREEYMQRRAHRHAAALTRKHWKVFGWLVRREAMFTTGANPLTPRRNQEFRAQLLTMHDDEVATMFRSFVAAWPARKIRQ